MRNEHQEQEAKRYRAMQEIALKQEEERDYDSSFEIPMLTEGKVPSEADIMAKNWSLHRKIRALKERQEFLKSVDKELVDRKVIEDAIEKDEFPKGLTQEKQEKYISNRFAGTDNTNKGAKDPIPQTQTEQALFLKEHANTFQYRYNPLIHKITSNIRYGTDEQATMDACVALASFHDIPALEGIPQDDVAFAIAASQQYSATHNFADIQNLQKQYYQTTKAEIEANDIRFKDIIANVGIGLPMSKSEKIEGYIDDFNKRCGIKLKGGWFEDDSPDMKKLNAISYDMIKRMFARTGNQNLAEMTTAQYIKGIAKRDKDGILHINPPTTTNTRFENATVLKSVSDNALKNAIEEAKKAGFGIRATTRPGEIEITNPNLIIEKSGKRRKLYYQCEDPLLKRPIYSVYFLADPKDGTSRQYLTNSKGRIIVDFDLLYEAREEARKPQELNNADNAGI